MAFHETLRAIRLAKGLTQPALAEAAQIEQSYLSKLENGRSSPSDEVLARLAAALGTTAEELMRNGAEGAAAMPAFGWRGIAVVAALVVSAIGGGWVLRGQVEGPAPGPRLESRVNGTLAERMYALAPPELKLERVSIDSVDGTITVLGRTVGRHPVTAYLAALRRAAIGEATLLQFADDDTRFHLVVTPFAPPTAASAGAPVTSP